MPNFLRVIFAIGSASSVGGFFDFGGHPIFLVAAVFAGLLAIMPWKLK